MDERELMTRLPALGEDPDPRIARALRLRAGVELAAIRERTRARTAARWGGAFAGATAAAAAAGLLLALVHPTAFAPRPKHPAPLDERIAAAREELDRIAEPDSPAGVEMRLDDRLQSIDRQLRCLETEIVEQTWDAPKGDTPCTES